MSGEEHLALSSFIKKIHKDLRTSSEAHGVEKAWSEHCKNESALQEYAECMKRLATEHWDKKHKDDIRNSRNAWIVHQINEYFTNEVYLKRRKKELTEKEINNLEFPLKTSQFEKPFSLLDVGSCYNPFKNIDNIVTTAIDICPASSDVYKCDFINLKVTDTPNCVVKQMLQKSVKDCERDPQNVTEEDGDFQSEFQERRRKIDTIKSMDRESFDVVVFSLLLEYIPCGKLRFQCCMKAYQLLKHEGILIIITPDSKHETSPNVQIMKKWKQVLQEIGFKRIKYEKLTHIHCMVFRKSSFILEFHDSLLSRSELLIPQDVNKVNSEEKVESSISTSRIDDKIANTVTTLPSDL